MLVQNNTIEIHVGDEFRFNKGRKHYTVINSFDYKGHTYMVIVNDGEYRHMDIIRKDLLCGVNVYPGCAFDGIVEVNGKQVRGKNGIILEQPQDVKPKVVKPKEKPAAAEETDFQKFLKVQKSGKINMTDIVRGAALAGISETKYEDILFNYDEYKQGKRN